MKHSGGVKFRDNCQIFSIDILFSNLWIKILSVWQILSGRTLGFKNSKVIQSIQLCTPVSSENFYPLHEIVWFQSLKLTWLVQNVLICYVITTETYNWILAVPISFSKQKQLYMVLFSH